MKTIFTRDFYLDKRLTEKKELVRGKKSLGEVYYSSSLLIAQMYKGKKAKYSSYIRYRSIENMMKDIEGFFNKLNEWEGYKETKRASKKAYKHDYKVGDILYTSWGYDQTNINFFQVTEVISDKMIEIREIYSRGVEDLGWCSRLVEPSKDSFKDDEKPLRKLVGEGGSVKIYSFAWASRYSGKPLNETSYA